jgi:BRCA1-associated protein
MRGYHIQIVLNPDSASHQPPADSFIPASLFQPLPSHSPKSTLRKNTLSRPNLNKDYRVGPISVDWIDFDQMSSILHGGKKAKEHGRGVKLHVHSLTESPLNTIL